MDIFVAVFLAGIAAADDDEDKDIFAVVFLNDRILYSCFHYFLNNFVLTSCSTSS